MDRPWAVYREGEGSTESVMRMAPLTYLLVAGILVLVVCLVSKRSSLRLPAISDDEVDRSLAALRDPSSRHEELRRLLSGVRAWPMETGAEEIARTKSSSEWKASVLPHLVLARAPADDFSADDREAIAHRLGELLRAQFRDGHFVAPPVIPALIRLAGEEGRPELALALNAAGTSDRALSPAESVEQVIDGLARLGGRDAIDALQTFLHSPSPYAKDPVLAERARRALATE